MSFTLGDILGPTLHVAIKWCQGIKYYIYSSRLNIYAAAITICRNVYQEDSNK